MIKNNFPFILGIIIMILLLFSGCSIARSSETTEVSFSATPSPKASVVTKNINELPENSQPVLPADSTPVVDTATQEVDNGQTQIYELNIDEVSKWFTMSKENILQMLSPEYEEIITGADDAYTGYNYKKLGFTFIFSPSGKSLTHITCDKNVVISNTHAGMNFEQIQEALGASNIKSVYIQDYQRTDYFIDYQFNNIRYEFSSNNETGENSRLTIIK